MHDKLALIAPILEAELNLKVVLHEADTDQLGTFSGEIERTLSPRSTAIAKAKLGMSALGMSLGLASEGSIAPDPLMPFTISDIEYLALVDSDLDIEIVVSYRSLQITAGKIITEPGSDLSSFLENVDFPSHKLIAQTHDKPGHSIKGIGTLAQLELAISELAAKSTDGKVCLQSDLRAHCSPSRQQNIIQTARQLAGRLKTLCPDCGTPGFGLTGYQRGLDCLECGEPVTTALKYEIYGCPKCPKQLNGPQIADYADPSSCSGCNP